MLTAFISVLLTAVAQAGNGADSESADVVTINDDNYVLTFNEEFNTFDRLSEDNPDGTWKTEFPWARWYTGEQSWVGRTLGGNNGELELYMDKDFAGTASAPLGYSPFSVQDGVLTITAARTLPEIAEHVMGFDYLSGMLSTETTFQQQYGYFEIRADLPEGQGLWPSFWMVRAETSGAGYPEIDVFEVLGQEPDEVHQTVHYLDGDGQHQMTYNTYTGIDSSDGFHTYGLEWLPGELRWYVDGTETFSAPISVDEPMYLYVTLAVGGDWPGAPDETTQFPAEMQIDYIRAYEQAPDTDPEDGATEPEDPVLPPPDDTGGDGGDSPGKGKKIGHIGKLHHGKGNGTTDADDQSRSLTGDDHHGGKSAGKGGHGKPGHAGDDMAGDDLAILTKALWPGSQAHETGEHGDASVAFEDADEGGWHGFVGLKAPFAAPMPDNALAAHLALESKWEVSHQADFPANEGVGDDALHQGDYLFA